MSTLVQSMMVFNQFKMLFIQFKMVSTHSGKPICATPLFLSLVSLV